MPRRADHSQDPVEIDVAGHPLLLDRAATDGSGRFVSPTARIVRPDRGSAVAGGLIGLFLAVAIAKPWSGPGGEARPRPVDGALAGPGARVGPAPSPTPNLSDLRRHCQEPLGWRVYSREGWNDQTLRAWRSVEPATGADGPLDPAIPVVQLGPRIEALGYCSPWTGEERPAAGATVGAWRVLPEQRDAGQYGTVTLTSIAPDRHTSLGGLFGPLVDPAPLVGPRPRVGLEPDAAPRPGWPGGRYVFAITSPGWERWWAVDVAEPDPDPTPAAAAPSAAPSVQPSPAATP